MFSRKVLARAPPSDMQKNTVLINLIMMLSIKMGNAIEIVFLCIF